MKKLKKVVIMTGYKCNNNCIFCYNLHKRNTPEQPISEIFNNILTAKKNGVNYLEIIGGEQTIRKDIIPIVKFADKQNFKIITMTTNGSMLCYKDFAKKIIAAGLNRVVFSIHGHNAGLHDSLTQARGSFDRLMEGIKNAISFGIEVKEIGSNTTIVKQNYKKLPAIGKLIFDLGIRNSEFIFVDPTRGAPYDNFKRFVPRLSEIAPFMNKCLDIGKKNKIQHWDIRYVPICSFRDYEQQISELNENKIFSNTVHLAPDFTNLDVEDSRKQLVRIKTKKCKKCKKFDICEGLWTEYYKHYGDSELKPIS